MKSKLANAILLGFKYFLIVFSFAFAMGMFRVLVLAPVIGSALAVFIEVPIVIAVSWIASRFLLRNRLMTMLQAAVMGTVAFILTMASEAGLAAVLRGEDFFGWASLVFTPLGLVGLASQVIFAAMPTLQLRSRQN